MQKIIINRCYGGFGLSGKATELYKELSGKEEVYDYEISRTCPYLIKVFELLGSNETSGHYADLKLIQIPDDVVWNIEEYDGIEWIAEEHRTWR
jgi:hypothetical protein